MKRAIREAIERHRETKPNLSEAERQKVINHIKSEFAARANPKGEPGDRQPPAGNPNVVDQKAADSPLASTARDQLAEQNPKLDRQLKLQSTDTLTAQNGESRVTRMAAWAAVVLGALSLPGSLEDLRDRFFAAPELRFVQGNSVTLKKDAGGNGLLAFDAVIANEGAADGIVTTVVLKRPVPGAGSAVIVDAEVQCSGPAGHRAAPPFPVTRGAALPITCKVQFQPAYAQNVLSTGSHEHIVEFSTSGGEQEEARLCFEVSPEAATQLAANIELQFMYPECPEAP
jgi:hypothetical protein